MIYECLHCNIKVKRPTPDEICPDCGKRMKILRVENGAKRKKVQLQNTPDNQR